MAEFTRDATRLLDLVGGKGNISSVTHCMTRMRFVLVDGELADAEGIARLPSVRGASTQAGQFQVIIGNDVADFYRAFCGIAGIDDGSAPENGAAPVRGGGLSGWVRALGEVLAPLVPMLALGGIAAGLAGLIGAASAFTDASPLAGAAGFWAAARAVLGLTGWAASAMLPVGICWSVARASGTTPVLGIVLGLTLVAPALADGGAVGSALAPSAGNCGGVVPALAGSLVLTRLERRLARATPEAARMVVVPLLSLVPAALLTNLIAYGACAAGDAAVRLAAAGLSSSARVPCAFACGALCAPLSLVGIRFAPLAAGAPLLGHIAALSAIAQGSALLALMVPGGGRAPRPRLGAACASCLLGTVEPAIFGAGLRYGYPIACGMAGAAVAAAVCALLPAEGPTSLSGGILSVLTAAPAQRAQLVALGLTAVAVSFALCRLAGRRTARGDGEAPSAAGRPRGAETGTAP